MRAELKIHHAASMSTTCKRDTEEFIRHGTKKKKGAWSEGRGITEFFKGGTSTRGKHQYTNAVAPAPPKIHGTT